MFRVSDVVEESLQDLQYAIDFSIYDQGAPPAEQFLGRYDATQGQVATQDQAVSSIDRQKRSLCPTAARCTHRLTVGQRQWTVAFSPAAGYSVEPGYGAIAPQSLPLACKDLSSGQMKLWKGKRLNLSIS